MSEYFLVALNTLQVQLSLSIQILILYSTTLIKINKILYSFLEIEILPDVTVTVVPFPQ